MENKWIEKMIWGVVGFDGDWGDFSVLVWVKIMEQKDWDGIVNSRIALDVGITG